jgi:hypothetical protein
MEPIIDFFGAKDLIPHTGKRPCPSRILANDERTGLSHGSISLFELS